MDNLYLLQNILRPGDILLTRLSSKASKGISFFTFGKFSHAALVINSSCKFESDFLGVGYTPIHVDRAEIIKGGYRLLSFLKDTEAAVLLRHPKLEQVKDEQSFAELLMETVNPFLGLQYPQFIKLATAFSPVSIFQLPARMILAGIDIYFHNRKVNPGPFCSQLVALVFKEIDCDIFKRERDPITVSPNTLKHSLLSVPLLKPIEDAICSADFSKENDTSLVDELAKHELSRHDFLPPLVRTKALLVELKPIMQKFSEACNKVSEFIAQQSNFTR